MKEQPTNRAGITVPAIRVQQNDHQMFVASLSADVLLTHTSVDKWTHSSARTDPRDQGYQREELRAHYSKVAHYLVRNRKAILPTSILLSVRGEAQFSPGLDSVADGAAFGHLTIPAASLPLYVVDGQHRIAGLRYAIEELGIEDVKSFMMPAVIMSAMPKFDEVQQFFLVNSTSKRIKTDLAQRLLTEMAEQDETVRSAVVGKGQAWLLRAVKIAEMLNDRSNSPWEGRVQRPNMRKVGEVMIAESSFTQSLKPILSLAWIQRLGDDKVAEILNRYWTAIMRFVPDALESPRDYALQKTTGVYPMHIIAPTILESCRSANDFSVDTMCEYLRPLQDEYLNELFWLSGEGEAIQFSSRAGFAVLADQMLNTLPEADPLELMLTEG